MSNDNCPICRGQKIKNDQCARCHSDLSGLRYIDGKLSAMYCGAFLAIKQEQYTIALDIILDLKQLKNDSFTQVLEQFLNHMVMRQVAL